MFFTVLRLSLKAVSASDKLDCMSTTSAVSIAISVPAPMAIPRSAAASAGAYPWQN